MVTSSRAILTFLVNKYAPGHDLYPEDAEKRALIDSRLYFDIGTLFSNIAKLVYPLFHGKEIDPDAPQTVREKLAFLDGFVADGKYAAGDSITLADYALLASVQLLDIVDFDSSEFANVASWRERMEGQVPSHEEINVEPLKRMKTLLLARSKSLEALN